MAESAAAPAIKPLFSADRIAARVDALAHDIASLRLDDLVIVAVLKGSFVFAADLVGALNRLGLRPEIDFLHLASYGDSTSSSGRVDIVRDMESALHGRDVMIVDDILDSGRTLAFAKALLEGRDARSVWICVLLDKQALRAVAITPDFVGFRCPPVFVVGYGMDLADRYRDLPYIGELAPDA
ncbi:MAG: hypoxanthine phosphoribosyltransferase [Methyloceanibacter sp.]|uniref:hypoxanthine phosphoribosyltransferase n=1 Tax=Methyloceanibacter sp. TaxID=1965321 RepID=UPI003D9BA958